LRFGVWADADLGLRNLRMAPLSVIPCCYYDYFGRTFPTSTSTITTTTTSIIITIGRSRLAINTVVRGISRSPKSPAA
jgi:hypothetical protein